METKQLMAHLQKLSVEIGPRYGGSQANHRAADYIVQQFTTAKLVVERQKFTCPNWTDSGTQLWLNGQTLPAVSNTFSPPCDVTATAVPVSTLAELEAAELAGRIAVLYGRLSQSTLSAKSWFLISDEEKHLIELLEAKQPAALITVQQRSGDLERIIEDQDFLIPSATVNAEVGLKLLQAPEATLHLQINTSSTPGYSENIVGRTVAGGPEKVVLCAHYDTKVDTPGACDNGSGTAVLLTMAQTLSQHTFPFTLEFVAFSNEEYLPLGDDEYVQCAEDTFEQIIAAINIDGVGQTIGSNSLAIFSSSEPFQQQIASLLKRHPGVVKVDPWPASNHYTFFSRDVPSIALSSTGHIYNIHLRSDRIDLISATKLAEVVAIVRDIVESLTNHSPVWTRPKETN